jgi:ribokinase
MILVAGSANLDFVVRAPHIPAPGETVLGSDFRTFAGGKGANQAIACARAGGVATQMLLGLGHDSFAEPIEASLNAAGVRLHVVRAENLPTGTAFICVSDDAENAITVAPGANSALRAEHLPDLKGVQYLLLQLETPLETVAAYAAAARKAGVKAVLNAAPAQALPFELLAYVDVLVVNEGELASISNCTGSVADCLNQLPDLPCIVVTLGGRGCCARVAGDIVLQRAFAVTPIDTTAAGDTFCGVLVASLAQQHTLALALERASAAAALACTRPGAQDSIPTCTEVDQFLSGQPVDAAANAEAIAALEKFAGLNF